MKTKAWKKGFTLIELLVVSLIIGILAAVALPQYEKAVDKSRVSSYFPLGESIRRAQEIYFLENGRYTYSLSDLTVDFPANCTVDKGDDSVLWCKSYHIDNIVGYIQSYLSSLAHRVVVWDYKNGKQWIGLHFFFTHSAYPNEVYWVPTDEDSRSLCKSLGLPIL